VQRLKPARVEGPQSTFGHAAKSHRPKRSPYLLNTWSFQCSSADFCAQNIDGRWLPEAEIISRWQPSGGLGKRSATAGSSQNSAAAAGHRCVRQQRRKVANTVAAANVDRMRASFLLAENGERLVSRLRL
jgi:hypothetical protein